MDNSKWIVGSCYDHRTNTVTTNDIFDRTGDAYLCLVHPDCRDDTHRARITAVIDLAPMVLDDLVDSMIVGSSWRERLLGLCIGMAKSPGRIVEPALRSLRDPRGICVVPICSALAVAARRGDFAMNASFGGTLDRQALDGELGWAIDKAMYYARLRADDVGGRGPNYGQMFENHVEVYDWIAGDRRAD